MLVTIENTSKPHPDKIAMDSSIWFVVIKSPILVLICQITSFKIICVNYDKLYCYRSNRQENCCVIKHFSLSGVKAGENAQQNEELHIIGEVPSLLETF